MKKITIGLLGGNQYKHLMPVLEQQGYNTVDLQKVFDSSSSDMINMHIFKEKVKKVDLLYNIYSGSQFWARATYAKRMGKKIITHWIGTDVLDALENKTGYLGAHFVDHNFSCYDTLKEELSQIGIESTVLPIVPFNMRLEVDKVPENHSVLIYMPEGRYEFYGYKECCCLFQAFPNMIFHVVANNNKKLFSEFPNVVLHGFLNNDEMNNLYNEISIYVRYTKHDGLSMSVIESLIKGKRVIWNNRFFGVDYANSKEEMIGLIKEIISQPPDARYDVSKEVARQMSKDAFANEFNRVINEVFR